MAKLGVQNQQRKVQATTDGLTGLANRAHSDTFLTEKSAIAVRNGEPLAVLLMDVDTFKSVNNWFGHEARDAVLQHLGKLFLALARPTDLAARYGGEELIPVLSGTDLQKAAQIAETFRRAVESRPVKVGNVKIAVTASVGVAVLEPQSPLQRPADLLKASDLAVYAAKHGRRNCIKVFALKPAPAAA